MKLFENLMKDIEKDENNVKKENEELMEPVNFLENSSIFHPELLKQKLINIDQMSDKEAFELIKKNYDSILSDTFVNQDIDILNLFKNERFLILMIQVMSSLTSISHSNRVYCNKIAYDYLTLSDTKEEIKNLMFTLSKTVNKDIIPLLLGLQLPNDLAAYLALARFSSLKETINIRRLNLIMMTSSIEIMTEQNIVWIYEKLFDNITILFEAIMFDVYEDINSSMSEIYSRISLAVLDILDNMPMHSIQKVLMSYIGDYNALYNTHNVRFSMRSLSNDYQRINYVVSMLMQQNIYIP